jgi:hypothetical protein
MRTIHLLGMSVAMDTGFGQSLQEPVPDVDDSHFAVILQSGASILSFLLLTEKQDKSKTGQCTGLHSQRPGLSD